MTFDMVEAELKKGIMHSIYLFYGNENYIIENTIKKIKKQFGELVQGINYIVIDENNINDLIFNIQSPPFGYDKKLIYIKDSGLLKSDPKKKKESSLAEEIGKFINENIDVINENVCLIFWEKDVNKNSIFNAISKNGVICEVNELSQQELIRRLKYICDAYKVNVKYNVLEYLIEVSGTDYQNLINEIKKLIEYVGSGGTINKEDVDVLAIKKPDSVIFDLTDSLGVKNIDKSMQILDDLIYQKEPLQKILVMLYNHFKKLYFCKIAIKEKKDVAKTLELKPNQLFLVNKYKRQASYFKEDALIDILEKLIDLDCNSKLGKIDLDIGLRSILSVECIKK